MLRTTAAAARRQRRARNLPAPPPFGPSSDWFIFGSCWGDTAPCLSVVTREIAPSTTCGDVSQRSFNEPSRPPERWAAASNVGGLGGRGARNALRPAGDMCAGGPQRWTCGSVALVVDQVAVVLALD